jgi:hypothetical protein
MKQTAVEWLIEKLTDEPEHYLFLCDKPEYMYGLTKIIQQALEMEKQQIIAAVEWNYKSNMGEVYYNAVYKNEQK